MENEKPKMTPAGLVLLLFTLGCFCSSVGLVVWAWIKPAFREEKPALVGKVSKEEYQKWKKVCDGIISDIVEEKLSWKMRSFPRALLEKVEKEREKIASYCDKQALSVEKFAFITRSLATAREYYIAIEKQNPEDRSVFPLDLLPENYDGPIPEVEPVFSEEDYKRIREEIGTTMEHNLRLYDEFREDIDITVLDLLEPEES